MGKSTCFAAASGIKRGPWTPEEDRKLLDFIQLHGHGSWSSLPQKAGLKRCGKSCRLRWRNYLRPDIKRGNFSLHEDQTIIQLHALLGNRWSAIAAHLPKRTDNEIKNYWNTHLKKRLAKIGFDPVTHKPKTAILGSANGDPKKLSNLSHIAQWESARLQAEARLSKESELHKSSAHQLLHDQTASLTHDHLHHQFPPLVPQCLDILRASAWESLISMSTKSSSSDADAPTNHINGGQNHVSFGYHHDVHEHGVNIISNFEGPTSDHQFSSMTECDDSLAMSSMTTGSLGLNELIGQDCGKECSELFEALQQYMGYEVEDGDAWTSLEQLL
ncbi:unnamed protein product [Prunus armeniaca]|uniref:Uncharacterized protein n=1 Tax=Prunus armeniaca TaxID=36596 RepID=A0A6J5XES7_PRUAR|nr:hypothetical protein GBA52_017631 [Prunus armeniaca]CAB4281030.1 unnamed protein product [Prunus armeniaca]CAB4311441.1 unnamed protein product [Prunus armeniaca]